MQRSSGILLPITALPSKYGIGTMGRAAYAFVDFLAQAGQRWWQILPLGPTGCGDSPYQSFSAYAGNPYLIDPELLCEEGLLHPEEVEAMDWGSDPERVDYARIAAQRTDLLAGAERRGWRRDLLRICRFTEENRDWIYDYALFMALKRHFHDLPWNQWPDLAIRHHQSSAVTYYMDLLRPDVELFIYTQYLFFRQWEDLRDYAHKQGVGIIGDLPIYVSADSADVWAAPENFQLDESQSRPVLVGGMPPDREVRTGQRWGNPLYNWERIKADNYRWWLSRVDRAGQCFDLLRLDHFQGLEQYWAVPYGEKTAEHGQWLKGPGLELIRMLQTSFPTLECIAEDLGTRSPETAELLRQSGMPGMQVLQYAYTPGGLRPGQFPTHSVCCTGTHDLPPLRAWLADAPDWEQQTIRAELGLAEGQDPLWPLLQAGANAPSELFVAQLQDYLGLGAEARMNVPGTVGSNWLWRVRPEALTQALARRIRALTESGGRLVTS